jgi:16S rRNA (cytidine1402-2'-O)-methyltransferase
MQSILYLLPTTLGENWSTIPEEVKEIASNLDIFIVENLRSGRRHLRKMGNSKEFDTEVSFYELDKHQANVENLFKFLNKHKDTGKNIGLMSEAGNPCIADPGAGAVELAHQLGLIVKPLVGPSSILMALIASGFNGQEFSFSGYLPIDNNEKRKALKRLENTVRQSGFTQIFMETPYRNEKLVEEMINSLDPNTKLCIAADIGEADEFIQTRLIKNWKQHPNLHKRPVVFVLGR